MTRYDFRAEAARLQEHYQSLTPEQRSGVFERLFAVDTTCKRCGKDRKDGTCQCETCSRCHGEGQYDVDREVATPYGDMLKAVLVACPTCDGMGTLDPDGEA